MLPLVLTLSALACAPLLDALSRRRPATEPVLDGLVRTVVLGVVLAVVLPMGVASAGWGALLALLLGWAGAAALHRVPLGERADGALAVLGLLLHAMVDGAALSVEVDARHPLAGAVVLHSLPVGLATWRIVGQAAGPRAAGLVLAGTGAAMVGGYLAGGPVSALSEGPALGLAMACLGGVLLHVLSHLVAPPARAAGLTGAALGLVIVTALALHELHTLEPAAWLGLGAVAALAVFHALGGAHAHGDEAAPPG